MAMETQAGGPGAFAEFDLGRVPSPCFVVDEAAVRRNLAVLKDVGDRGNAKVLLALKAFSMWALADLVGRDDQEPIHAFQRSHEAGLVGKIRLAHLHARETTELRWIARAGNDLAGIALGFQRLYHQPAEVAAGAGYEEGGKGHHGLHIQVEGLSLFESTYRLVTTIADARRQFSDP